jgi:8-hydroxy-5-deazaflavin:NADPH oxidoreductase
VRIAVLGGTGSFGSAVAVRLREAGYDVCIGSRDAERAAAAAAELGVEGRGNAAACEGVDLVVLATKADAAIATARELRGAIGTTPVLSVAAELSFGPDGVKPTTEATSIAQRIQDELDAPVVAGLHSLAASNLGGDEPPDEDTLVCGDDADAKALVGGVIDEIPGMRWVDCGALSMARITETLTALLISVNRQYKVKESGFRIEGREAWGRP